MRRGLRTVPFILLGIAASSIIASAISCKGASTSREGAAPALVLGAMAPLRGPEPDLGLVVQNVLEVAQGVLNAAGGILGQPVVIKVFDDQNDAANANAAADYFLAPSTAAVGVIGPSSSDGALAVHARFQKAHRLLITPLALSPLLTSAEAPNDRYLFRTEPSATLQARAGALFATKYLANADAGGDVCHTFALIDYNDQSGTGKPIGDAFVKAVEPMGGSVTLRLDVDPNAVSYDAEAGKVVSAGADCQVVLMLAQQGAIYMRSFRDATSRNSSRDWTRFTTLGTTGFYQQGFIANGRQNPADDTELSAAEGVYGTALDPAPATPEYGGFINIYDTYFPKVEKPQPIPPLAATYDAAILLALAIQRAGRTDNGDLLRTSLLAVSAGNGSASARTYGPADVSDAIAALKQGREINYQGASGNCDFDASGDVIADHIIWHVEHGKFVTVRSIKAAEIAQ